MGIAVEEQRVRFGDFELDLRTRELWNNKGQKLTLQEQPFQILAMLLERSGQLVTRDELTRKLWPAGRFVDFEHSLNKAVNRLREALEDSAGEPRLIETLPRRGYRLIAQLQPALPIVESAAKAAPRRLGLSSLGAVLVSACLLLMWIWIRRETKQPDPEFQRLTFGRGMIRSARFAPDGQSVVYGAAWDGKPSQLFWAKDWIQDVTAGKPLPITPEGTTGRRVSPDGKLLVAVDQERNFWIYPTEGTEPAALAGIKSGEDAIRWSADGKSLFVASDTMPVQITRVEIATGRRQLLYKIAPADLAGIWNIWPVLITPDGKSYVYSDYRIRSDLYLASGLK